MVSSTRNLSCGSFDRLAQNLHLLFILTEKISRNFKVVVNRGDKTTQGLGFNIFIGGDGFWRVVAQQNLKVNGHILEVVHTQSSTIYTSVNVTMSSRRLYVGVSS